MATRRERKLQEAKDRELSGRAAARRFRVKVFTITAGVTGIILGGAALFMHLTAPGAGRGPASGVPPELAEKAKKKEQTLDEVKAELAAKETKAKKTKEWIWAEEGRTELVLDAYRKQTGRSSAAREERTRLLNILGRTAKPREQWPAAFNDEKARAVLDLFAEILRGDHAPGPEPITAVQNLAAFARLNPDFRGMADRELQAYYASDTRIGPRGETLMALAQVGSVDGLELAAHAVLTADGELARSAAYALGTYLDFPSTEKKAVFGLRDAAKQRVELRPLAVKLLANHGSREIASLVPQVLHKGATPQEVEAGAFAASKLRLKELRGLLVERLQDSQNPFVSQEVDAAIKELDQAK